MSGFGFSGSYDPADVTFLLTPITGAMAEALYVAPQAKETLIQQGRRHYSEMISREGAPGAEYLAIFDAALRRHGSRMGCEVAALARDIATRVEGAITLCSLVRAGVPLGVLLRRALVSMGRDCAHYGVSIIRDRGIDQVALDHILARHPASGIVFVDGWTGKGAIADELAQALTDWPEVQPRMAVLADPAGRAWLSASQDDWLIPSGILGSTVSGLISRSILNDAVVPRGGYHAAIHLKELAFCDVSRRFVDAIGAQARIASAASAPGRAPDPNMAHVASGVIDAVADLYGITNRNRIKPGIAEATRAVLRRAPERILVAGNADDPDLAGLRHLARKAGVVVEVPTLSLFPYRAITIIADREKRAI